MKVKTRELHGATLNWAVAMCEGWTATKAQDARGEYLWLWKEPRGMNPKHYHPSTHWGIGGPIIEREIIMLDYDAAHDWEARDFDSQQILAHGPTPLIAAMRCYVASKLGDVVEVPDELTTQTI
jgi:hypothetical protein